MICNRCGVYNNYNSIYCYKCGNKLPVYVQQKPEDLSKYKDLFAQIFIFVLSIIYIIAMCMLEVEATNSEYAPLNIFFGIPIGLLQCCPLPLINIVVVALARKKPSIIKSIIILGISALSIVPFIPFISGFCTNVKFAPITIVLYGICSVGASIYTAHNLLKKNNQ